MKPERRFFPIEQIELRVIRDGESVTLTGMAPPFNTWSPVYGDFRERFLPGAFDNSEADVIATWEHDNGKILGRVSAGNLTLEDREDGSHFTVQLGNRTYENDLAESIERGDVRGSSFEFRTREDGDEWRKVDGIWERTVMDAERVQVGPVASPFYPDSTAALRSLEGWQEAHPEGGRIEPSHIEYMILRQRHLRRRMELG